MKPPSFRDDHPVAWTFHRNSTPSTAGYPGARDRPPLAPYKEYLGSPLEMLPPARLPGTPLAAALAARSSCRRFAPEPPGGEALSTILHAAYAIRGRSSLFDQEFFERPVPSAGGLFPLEVYLFAGRVEGLAPATYHYHVALHALERIGEAVSGADLARLFLGQPYVGDAAAVLVLTAVVERSLWKYRDRGYRYLLIEAGHVAQNVNLMAAALGLGAVDLGGFFDAELAELLGLDSEEEIPLYGIAVGNPASAEASEAREPETGA
ncbi:hypothetical protein BH20GEM2_BH20GEM2_20440 [soil metagenome]